MPRHPSLPKLVLALGLALLASCTPDAADPTGVRPEQSAAGGVAPLHAAQADGIAGRYIVVYREGVMSASAETAALGLGAVVHHRYGTSIDGFAATLSPEALAAVRRDPAVAYVEQDGLVSPDAAQQDGVVSTDEAQEDAPWGLDRIDQRDYVNGLYHYDATGKGVTVYVIDSGIRIGHNDFGTRASVGVDFVGDGLDGRDCSGHGTHVAGTIAGEVYGVAKRARVVSVRIFPCEGGTPASTVIAGLDWVGDNAEWPAVANLSAGGGYSLALNEAAQTLIDWGVPLVTAAGSRAEDACLASPASIPEAITVASTDDEDMRSVFSNFGPCVDLFAPGSRIESTGVATRTAILSGTSMAAAHVSGVAALQLEENPYLGPAELAAAIVGATTPDRVSNAGAGSPNKLLFSRISNPAAIHVDRTPLRFSFVRLPVAPTSFAAEASVGASVSGWVAKGGEPKVRVEQEGDMSAEDATFAPSVSHPLLMRNLESNATEWTASSDQGWLTVAPSGGLLFGTARAFMTIGVNGGALAPGIHDGAITIADEVMPGSTSVVPVTATVVDAMVLGLGEETPEMSAEEGNLAYWMLVVPPGTLNLTISTRGIGDVDLFVRAGDVPNLEEFDCASTTPDGYEFCQHPQPPAGTYYILLHAYTDYSEVSLGASSQGGLPAAPTAVLLRPVSPTTIEVEWAAERTFQEVFYVERSQRASSEPESTWSDWEQIAFLPPSITELEDDGAEEGWIYRYRVRTCNYHTGCSTPTLSGVARTLVAAPTDAVATLPTATTAHVSWADESGGEERYELFRRARPPGAAWGGYAPRTQLPANTTAFDDEGLTPGYAYQYRLRACHVAACSDFAVSGSVAVPFVPAAPSGPRTEPLATGRIRFTWGDASNNETTFELERRSHAPAAPMGGWLPLAPRPAHATSFEDADVVLGDTYQHRVRACNLAGCSGWAEAAELTMPTIPAAPTGVSPSQRSPTEVRVRWSDASTNETRFELYRRVMPSGGSFGGWAKVSEPARNATYADQVGLTAGDTYQFRIRACQLAICSPYTSGPAITPDVPPAAPTGVVGNPVSRTRIDVGWSDGSGNETRFEVRRSLRGADGSFGPYEAVGQTTVDDTTFTSSGLMAGATYRFRVRACNLGGCSSYVPSGSVTTPN